MDTFSTGSRSSSNHWQQIKWESKNVYFALLTAIPLDLTQIRNCPSLVVKWKIWLSLVVVSIYWWCSIKPSVTHKFSSNEVTGSEGQDNRFQRRNYFLITLLLQCVTNFDDFLRNMQQKWRFSLKSTARCQDYESQPSIFDYFSPKSELQDSLWSDWWRYYLVRYAVFWRQESQ